MKPFKINVSLNSKTKMAGRVMQKGANAMLLSIAGYELGEKMTESKHERVEARKIESLPAYSLTEIIIAIIVLIVVIFVLLIIRECIFKKRDIVPENATVRYVSNQGTQQATVHIPAGIRATNSNQSN